MADGENLNVFQVVVGARGEYKGLAYSSMCIRESVAEMLIASVVYSGVFFFRGGTMFRGNA